MIRAVFMLLAAGLLLVMLPVSLAQAEDGYDLWLRYHPLPSNARAGVASHAKVIVAPQALSAVSNSAVEELQTGLEGLLTAAVPIGQEVRDGAIVLGTPQNNPAIGRLALPMEQLGDEGYIVRNLTMSGHETTVIAANSDIGLVYGVFELLRQLQTGVVPGALDIIEVPKIGLRLLNHWDNLDRYVERGYAGQSIWDWWRLPDILDPRYTDYARANASIGINGTVLNLSLIHI